VSRLAAIVRLGRALRRAQQGVAATEFGLIALPFFTLLIGSFDVAHQTYARSVFVGAVERAARDASLETGDPEAIDQQVQDNLGTLLPDLELTTVRTSYYDFADIKKPERFTDNKGKNGAGQWNPDPGRDNGKCDYGESYEDFNRNGKWDADTTAGAKSNGGAGDVVMYTVTATYTPLFKIPFAPEIWNKRTMTATAIKKNQPFAQQNSAAAGTCT
jgi:Flp pilus assembly protein TadG